MKNCFKDWSQSTFSGSAAVDSLFIVCGVSVFDPCISVIYSFAIILMGKRELVAFKIT